jgi:hypothetical protein
MAVGMSAFVFAAALSSVTPTGAPIPVSDGAVMDDMLVQPQPKVYRWTVRIVPASLDDDMVRMIHWLKLDRTLRLVDDIDATVPPRQPEVPSPAAPAAAPQMLLARMLIPLR